MKPKPPPKAKLNAAKKKAASAAKKKAASAAKKKAASAEKRPGSNRVKVAVPAAAISANEPLVGGAAEASGVERMFAILFYILLFSLPVLLMIAALRQIVPYNAAHGGEDIRIPVAFCGLFLLVIEGFMYLMVR